MPYFDNPENADGSISEEMNVKFINCINDNSKFLILAKEKRLLLLEGNSKETEIKVDPIWEEKFKKVKQVNIENVSGQKKVIKNNGVEQSFIIKTQTSAEMRAIAKVVHRVSLKVLEDKKKNDELKKEESQKQEYFIREKIKINLNALKDIDNNSDEKWLIGKTSTTFRKILRLQQETAINEDHQKKYREKRELQEIMKTQLKLHSWIILTEVSSYNLRQANIEKDNFQVGQKHGRHIHVK